LDVIEKPDGLSIWGPEGVDRGGEIVAEGPPKEIAKSKRSYTGQVLREARLGARG
jgi:excinuclease ABC subunit A